MVDLFRGELLAILVAALIVLGTLAVIFWRKVVVPRVAVSDFWRRYGGVIAALDSVVSDVVLRIAFSGEDLSFFQAEAKRTGRDVRLVAAMHLVNIFTTEHGIELPEEIIVSSIEGNLGKLKQEGVIPRNNVISTQFTSDGDSYIPTPGYLEQQKAYEIFKTQHG